MLRVNIPKNQIKPLDEAIAIWKDRSLGEHNYTSCPLCNVYSDSNVCEKCVYSKSTGYNPTKPCTEAWRAWGNDRTTKTAKRVFNELEWIKENQL